jgi:alpha-D-xyloside xylohydrolase
MIGVQTMLRFNFVLYCSAILLFAFACTLLATGKSDSIIKLKNTTLKIEFKSPTIIRITETQQNAFSKRASLSVIDKSKFSGYKKIENKDFIQIKTDSLIVKIDKTSGDILFLDKKNKQILKAVGSSKESFITEVVQDEKVFNIKQNFTLTQDEGLYGLGQFEDALFNWRGKDVLIEQANRTAVNPFLISTNGYGIFWDNYSETKFHDGSDGTHFWSRVADEIDYYFVYGPSMDKVIAGYRKLTGTAPMFGKWAYGYWQSKERYMTGNELLSVIREYRKRNIPFDNIIQDWQYWGENDQFSGMIWDKERFPNPKALMDTIHLLNSHIIASIWPGLGAKSDIYLEMEKKGFLYKVPHWNGGKVYDAYNPEARKIYWKYLKKGLFDNGIDGYWMDGSEPEFRCTDDRYITSESILQTGRNFLGIAARYLTPFSLPHTEGVYKNQRAVTDKKRVFILTRSVFGGQQRSGSVTWSGDTFATWENLKLQVAAGLNLSVSGIPYWNSDIGGFNVDSRFPGGCKNESYRELYVRWFQFGTFCPMFRSHGTSTPREMWQFGDKGSWAYDALVKFDKLRYRLMPYIYSIAWKVTNEGYSFLRGLMMDFTEDKNAYNIGNQFMFGSSIMITPVLKPIYHPSQDQSLNITTDRLFSSDGKEAGAELAIYKGSEFNQLFMKRKTDASSLAWFGCVPLELDSSYSVRFDGKILSDDSGEYKFSLVTDGGIRFWIDNKLVIDEWNNADNKTYTVKATFNADIKYNFKVEYKELHPNTANLKITWTKPISENQLEKTVNVYLPQGIKWFDFWSGKNYNGGQTIKVDSPIDVIPIFIPAGSILPMGPDIQFAAEKNDPIELRIYPGADGSFEIYEDENDNYNYEKGIYSTIKLDWNDAKQELTIGQKKGSYPGMPKTHTFDVVVVKEKRGAGAEASNIIDKTITYSGKRISVIF